MDALFGLRQQKSQPQIWVYVCVCVWNQLRTSLQQWEKRQGFKRVGGVENLLEKQTLAAMKCNAQNAFPATTQLK